MHDKRRKATGKAQHSIVDALLNGQSASNLVLKNVKRYQQFPSENTITTEDKNRVQGPRPGYPYFFQPIHVHRPAHHPDSKDLDIPPLSCPSRMKNPLVYTPSWRSCRPAFASRACEKVCHRGSPERTVLRARTRCVLAGKRDLLDRSGGGRCCPGRC